MNRGAGVMRMRQMRRLHSVLRLGVAGGGVLKSPRLPKSEDFALDSYAINPVLCYTCLMTTIQQTVTVPVNRRIHLNLDLSLADRFPPGETRFEIVLNLPSREEIRAKNKAAWEKLRELAKDSTLTVEKFLEMKNADRDLEAAIEERARSGIQ